MKIYFPMIVYPVPKEEGGDVCDFILQGFAREEDAKALYPEAEIKEFEFPESNPLLN